MKCLKVVWSVVCVTALAGACSDSGDDPTVPTVQLSGAVEKGPFLLGTTVNVSPVDRLGNPLGQVFSTQTTNDLGQFRVTFTYSGPVLLEGNGYYYNEVTGALSDAQLTLRAFYEVGGAGAQDAYLNPITHLTQNRIKRLLEDGVRFGAAVSQAEAELVTALEVGPPSFSPGASGTSMNILGGDTDANAYLFAVSAVLARAAQLNAGEESSADAELQELMNRASLDLSDDGAIAPALADQIRAGEATLDTAAVIAALQAHIAASGSTAIVPDIGRIIDGDEDGHVYNDDCNDRDPLRWTGNADLDQDGQVDKACGGDDCDDDEPAAHVGADPVCGGGKDFNCDGVQDDLAGCGGCPTGVPTVLAGPLSVGPEPVSVFVVGDNAYVASDSLSMSGGGLFVVDVSTPSAPTIKAGPAATGGVAKSVFVDGEHAFVGGMQPGANGASLYLFDVSDPGAPSQIGDPHFEAVWGTFAQGAMAYVRINGHWPGGGGGIYGVDMTYPAAPEPLPNPITDVNGPMWVVNTTVYVAGQSGLVVVDASDPRNPQLLAGPVPYKIPPAAYVTHCMVASSTHAFVIAGMYEDTDLELLAFDVSSPTSPSVVGSLTNPSDPSATASMAAGHDALYVAGTGINVIDVTNPAAPVVNGPFETQIHVRGIFVSGDYAYVAARDGLYVLALNCP